MNKSESYRKLLNMFKQVYGNAPVLALGGITATEITLTIIGTDEKISFTFFTSAQASKLAGIEAGADVTDATNVAAAGAVMHEVDPDFSAWLAATPPAYPGDIVVSDTLVAGFVTIFLPDSTGLFYEETDFDVRIRDDASTPGDNILLAQGFRKNGSALEIWV